MKIGLDIPRFNWPGSPENTGSKLAEMARVAEKAGFSSLWVMDHFFQVGQGYGPPEDPMLEGYSVLSYLAAVTRKMRLGVMVTGNPYRHPGVLIKTVSTLDVLSGGRAYLGIGTGWYEEEARALGIPFPMSTGELIGRLEETLRIAHHMWRGDRAPFQGKYYRLEQPINNPQPLSSPHPPILIGGEGERKMLRLVAMYGDACNFHLGTPLREFPEGSQERFRTHRERLARKLESLKVHCREAGRSYDEIERTVLGAIRIAPDAMSCEDVVEICRGLAELGFQHVMFNMSNDYEIEPLEIIGEEVIPQIADL